MSYYVFSTLSNSIEFNSYSLTPRASESPPQVLKDNDGKKLSVFIRGGANCVNQIPDGRVYTPKGVVTTISDEDYAWMEKDPTFCDFIKSGFFKVEMVKATTKRKSKKAQEALEDEMIEKAVSTMTKKDNSAQIRHNADTRKPESADDFDGAEFDSVSVGADHG